MTYIAVHIASNIWCQNVAINNYYFFKDDKQLAACSYIKKGSKQ